MPIKSGVGSEKRYSIPIHLVVLINTEIYRMEFKEDLLGQSEW